MSAAKIQHLAERIEAIERKHATIATRPRSHEATKVEWETMPLRLATQGSQARSLLATGLGEIDEALGGGLRAGMHEWYLGAQSQSHEAMKPRRSKEKQPNRQRAIGNRQFVPLCLLAHLAWRALEANPSRWIIWIGRECFPYPAVLVREAGRDLRLLQRSLFVQAPSAADRVWVADLSIRCGLAGAVIADGTGLDMAATRRLQLAAKSRGSFVFLARPPQDLDRLSAAMTRWLVLPGGMPKPGFAGRRHGGAALDHATQDSPHPRWNLELLRCKGMQPSTSRRVWLVEWNRATNVIGVHTPVGDSFAEQPRSSGDQGGSRWATKPRRAMG